eukprot:jgi/Botrbrau1/15180/Bobra.0149s0045.1
MRSYIATFNALRSKVPKAFAEETLCHLFLAGCRADLQKSISLQYPQTLEDYFKHAVTISDLPGPSKPVNPAPKFSPDSKSPGPTKTSAQPCAHCGKSGHAAERLLEIASRAQTTQAQVKYYLICWSSLVKQQCESCL